MRQNNTLVINYLFILSLLLAFIPLVIVTFTKFAFLPALTLTILSAIFLSFLIVKTLLAPLFSVSKKMDNLLKETLHELNIPVSTINANASMLKKRLDDPKQLRQTQRIIEASQHLLQMHESLSYSIKKEFHTPQKSRIDLKLFVEQRLDHYRTLYPQVTFEVDLHPTLIEVDAHGLQKSIDNLVSNSVKYALKDPIIGLQLQDYQLIITDNGKGIDESQLLRIFERYYQEESSNEGYGIGLSIVKSFCDAQSIKLSITSKPNTFTKVVLNFWKLKTAEET